MRKEWERSFGNGKDGNVIVHKSSCVIAFVDVSYFVTMYLGCF